VRWPTACEDVSLGAEERRCWKPPPSSAVKTVTENTSLCVIVICSHELRIKVSSKSDCQSVVTQSRDNMLYSVCLNGYVEKDDQ
jgi:hypothetical protein